MKQWTDEECEAVENKPIIYVDTDGNEFEAIVAACDPEVGYAIMSCDKKEYYSCCEAPRRGKLNDYSQVDLFKAVFNNFMIQVIEGRYDSRKNNMILKEMDREFYELVENTRLIGQIMGIYKGPTAETCPFSK
jgi:hypothetical protein